MTWHQHHYDRYEREQQLLYDRLEPKLPPDVLEDLKDLLACMRLVAKAAMYDADSLQEKVNDLEAERYFIDRERDIVESAVQSFRVELNDLPEAER